MLKLHHFFFANVVGLFLSTLIISSIVSYYTLKTFVVTANQEELKQSISLLQLQTYRLSDLDRIAANTHAAIQDRVTFVAEDGLVLADSNSDKFAMENHADRYEIMQARRDGLGIDTRYSATIHIHYLYVAKKILVDDQIIYLRLATPLHTVMSNFYTLWSRLIIIFAIFMVIGLILSYQMSKRVRYDIAQIAEYLEELSNKNYKAVIKTRYFSEFLHIALNLKDLAKKLDTRDRQKRKYTAKLRLVNKQRNDILSAISHEFKNPIASIIGYADTIIDDPQINPKIRVRFLEKILSNARKITYMIDRLAFSVKLDNNDLTIHPTHFNLADLVQDVSLNLSKKYRDREILFNGEACMVYADKDMLDNVLTNLIDNALKYSEDDVTVTISEGALMVIDKGMGISESDLDKVASKFYRVNKNTWDNSLGLGLAIVSYILKLHDSELIIESKVGEGSRFGFSLKSMSSAA
ncbi:MAG: HAMP domain-containing histidine kinase [Thiovulaceae bacterium]|nr:HAMP domain-containing histidine kinase [Sulfurimonadaceae bacterium]